MRNPLAIALPRQSVLGTDGPTYLTTGQLQPAKLTRATQASGVCHRRPTAIDSLREVGRGRADAFSSGMRCEKCLSALLSGRPYGVPTQLEKLSVTAGLGDVDAHLRKPSSASTHLQDY